MNITKERMKQIVKKGEEQGLNPNEIFKQTIDRGYSIEGFDTKKFLQEYTGSTSMESSETDYEPTVSDHIDSIKDTFYTAAEKRSHHFNNGDYGKGLVAATGGAIGTAGNAVAGALETVDDVLGEVPSKVWNATVGKVLSKPMEWVGNAKQKLDGYVEKSSNKDSWGAVLYDAGKQTLGGALNMSAGKGTAKTAISGAKVAGKVSKAVGSGVKKKVKGGLKAVKNIDETSARLNGVSEETIETIKSNPDKYVEFKKKNLDMDDIQAKVENSLLKKEAELKNIGKQYDFIAQDKSKFNFNKEVTEVLNKNGLKLDKKYQVVEQKVHTSKIPDSDLKVIQKVVDSIRKKTTINTQQAHNLRQKIDEGLWNRKTGVKVKGKGADVVTSIRDSISKKMHESVPKLKKIDELYYKTSKEIRDAKKIIYNSAGDIKTQLSSKLKKIDNYQNKNIKKQLNKVSPDVVDDMKYYNAVADINKMSLARTASSMGTDVIATIMLQAPGLLASKIATSPKVAEYLLIHKTKGGLKVASKTKPIRQAIHEIKKGNQYSSLSKQTKSILNQITRKKGSIEKILKDEKVLRLIENDKPLSNFIKTLIYDYQQREL